MATKTTNYQFIKPDLTDDADIRVINENFDLLDNMIFQSGELGNHTGDSDAHIQIFKKYLPLTGGTMTGTIDAENVTTNLGYTTFNKNVYMQGSNSLRFDDNSNFTIQNGYGKTYGADIILTGNDVTNANYTAYKNNVRVKASTDSTKFTQLRVAPGGVEITRGASNTNKFDLKVPEFTVNHITSYQSTLAGEDNYFIQSYNGRCAIDFRDVNNNPDSQYIKIKVNDNTIKIDDSGVFYNDKLSLFVEEYNEVTTTVNDNSGDAIITLTTRVSKYATGLLIIEYDMKRNTSTPYSNTTTYKTLTYPMPFKDDTYVVSVTGSFESDSSYWLSNTMDETMWRKTSTTGDFIIPPYKRTMIQLRGRWK